MIKIPYRNWEGQRWVRLDKLIESLRAQVAPGKQVTVNLELLVEWLEQAQFEDGGS